VAPPEREAPISDEHLRAMLERLSEYELRAGG